MASSPWRSLLGSVLFAALAACNGTAFYPDGPTPPGTPSSESETDGLPALTPTGTLPDTSGDGTGETSSCGNGQPLRVHFFDVGQGLSALVELPDGRTLLVDTGDAPNRYGCGDACVDRHQHLMNRLAEKLAGRPLTLLWVTHQHSDHLGGAPDILETFQVQRLVDNGRDPDSAQVQRMHASAQARGTPYEVVAPGQTDARFPGNDELTVRAVVPSTWAGACELNENDCSIGLRIDYCQSSVLFTGDLETTGEANVTETGPVTLLQVGHHGSDTSSSEGFIRTLAPKYAVISAAQMGIGLNKTYCHPRLSTVQRLNLALGGIGGRLLKAYGSSTACPSSTEADWVDNAVSNRLFATPLDGDVTLMTRGDGRFDREP